MDGEECDGGVEKWRNHRKWLTRTRTNYLCQPEVPGPWQRESSLPHENMKTRSVNLTMGKWRRLPR